MDHPEGGEPCYLCTSSIILAFKIHLDCIRTPVYLHFINVKNGHEIL